ncbi:MAG: DUF1217 domain-containing protein [Hyphomicrobiales bacterium]|nr:DUF1217 domain-containing protein [Hyphomicrobiales bacterium]MCA1999778.1 DUF1217 domain-containing protein [Hyphomicrobiales bacterium]
MRAIQEVVYRVMMSFFDTGVSNVSISPLVYFNRIAKATRDKHEAQFAKSATVKRELEYFKEKSAKVASADEFLNNYRLLSVATSAFGLEDAMQYGFRTKAIAKSDATDPESLLNKFTDTRYREFNLAFEFFSKGVTKLQSEETQKLVSARYVTNEYERSLGEIDSSLQEAAYFIRTAGSKTQINQIISDPVLFGVVIDTLGISRAAAGGDFNNLKARIEQGFDMSRLKDAAYVEKFAQRFLAIRSSQAQLSAGNPLIGIFANNSA